MSNYILIIVERTLKFPRLKSYVYIELCSEIETFSKLNIYRDGVKWEAMIVALVEMRLYQLMNGLLAESMYDLRCKEPLFVCGK